MKIKEIKKRKAIKNEKILGAVAWLREDGRAIEEMESRGLIIGGHTWIRDDDDQDTFWNQMGTDYIEVFFPGKEDRPIAILATRCQGPCENSFWRITEYNELPQQ